VRALHSLDESSVFLRNVGNPTSTLNGVHHCGNLKSRFTHFRSCKMPLPLMCLCYMSEIADLLVKTGFSILQSKLSSNNNSIGQESAHVVR
jgi:hypothetical protein